MFRVQRYFEKVNYVQFSLETPLTFPGINQYQQKNNKLFLKDRDNVYEWYNAHF